MKFHSLVRIRFLLGIIILGLISSCKGGLSFQLVARLFQYYKDNCRKHGDVVNGCPSDLDDRWACWKSAPKNTTSEARCNPIYFEPGLMTRYCGPDGKWHKQTYVTSCTVRDQLDILRDQNDLIISVFYNGDNSGEAAQRLRGKVEEIRLKSIANNLYKFLKFVSIGICFISLVILAWIRPFKDKRFILHFFLVFALMCHEIFHVSQLYFENVLKTQNLCTKLFLMTQYFFMTTVFMMFSEGLYQFRQFYFVIITEYRPYTYVIFSYGCSAVLIFGIYLPGMYFDLQVFDMNQCLVYFDQNVYRWILNAVVLVLLLFNTMIMIYMMVLIASKLRHDKRSTYTKAMRGARGFLALIFLLGFCYLLTYFMKYDAIWLKFVVAIVQPQQGIWICFLQVINTKQVKSAFRKKFRCYHSRQMEKQFSVSRSSTTSISET